MGYNILIFVARGSGSEMERATYNKEMAWRSSRRDGRFV